MAAPGPSLGALAEELSGNCSWTVAAVELSRWVCTLDEHKLDFRADESLSSECVAAKRVKSRIPRRNEKNYLANAHGDRATSVAARASPDAELHRGGSSYTNRSLTPEETLCERN